MRVTLWKPGLFIINRAENKRLYFFINKLSFGFENRTSKYVFMIFQYFVFSTVLYTFYLVGCTPKVLVPVNTQKGSLSCFKLGFPFINSRIDFVFKI